ncbi:MAG: response regulator transcription factor [Gallionellaceae bacterium]|nr:response regulator transcription factor [Gallionellaceae bacterium]
MVRLMITDDHELVRAGLVQYLGMSPDIDVVAEAKNCNELLEKLRTVTPDLLLLDLSMPGKSGVDMVAHVRSLYPDLLILVLSMHNEVKTVLHVMKAGASGFICKDCSPQVLLDAIRKVVATGKYLSPVMAEQLAYASTLPGADHIEMVLSARELEIFRLIVDGKSAGEIADQLCISNKTVSTHKSHLLDKLGLKNIAELVHYAIENKLFDSAYVASAVPDRRKIPRQLELHCADSGKGDWQLLDTD